MRIALLAAFPLPFIPGLEGQTLPRHYATWLPQLSAGFSEQPGLEVHWLVVTREKIAREPIRWKNQTFHCLHVPGKLRLLRGYWRESAVVRERLRSIRPELVHAWGTEQCYGIAGARCGWPWLLSMQGILREYLRRLRMPPLVYVQAIYEWLAVRRARQICAESPWACEAMRRLAPRAQVHRVEYGVQSIFFETRWEPRPERPLAVFVGTVEERKGLRDAIAAFAHPALAGAELQVAGDADNPLGRSLRAQAGPNVHWLGRLSAAETAALLAQAWCLVLPTRADTGPMAVKEARVVGLPVISSPHGGPSTYITSGANGFLVEPGDIAGLAVALQEVLSSLETARTMGACRWAEQREEFHPRRTVAEFLRLYAELIETRPEGYGLVD